MWGGLDVDWWSQDAEWSEFVRFFYYNSADGSLRVNGESRSSLDDEDRCFSPPHPESLSIGLSSEKKFLRFLLVWMLFISLVCGTFCGFDHLIAHQNSTHKHLTNDTWSLQFSTGGGAKICFRGPAGRYSSA